MHLSGHFFARVEEDTLSFLSLRGLASEIALVNANFALDEAVEITADVITLDVHQQERRNRLLSRRRVRTGRASRVDEELAVHLERLEAVRVARDQDVAVELALHDPEGVAVAPGDNLVPVGDADPELLDRDHLGLWPRAALVELAFDDVNICRDCLQVIESFLRAEVASRQDIMDLPGNLREKRWRIRVSESEKSSQKKFENCFEEGRGEKQKNGLHEQGAP